MPQSIIHKVLLKLQKALLPNLCRRINHLEYRLSSLEKTHSSLIERASRFIACEMIEGDYLEFGVYRGASFSQSYKAITKAFQLRIRQEEGAASIDQQLRRRAIIEKMRFFAFDSFEGLPPLKGLDKHTVDFAEGQYAATQKEFEHNLISAGVNLEKVQVVPGWFNQTCNQETWRRLSLKKAAIIWIDGDLYESARSALFGVSDLIQDGTIIIFDDWFAFRGSPNLGEQKAFREWIEHMPDYQAVPFHQEGTWRNSFIMSRKLLGL